MGKLLPLSPVPLYSQLKELLRGRILDGVYPPLSRMPSENELGKAFDVSRITVRQALGDLQKEGLIFKIHGKGTFVARPKAFQNVSTLQGLGESLTQMGYEVINRLHGLRYVPAGAQVAERLRVKRAALCARSSGCAWSTASRFRWKSPTCRRRSASAWRRPTW